MPITILLASVLWPATSLPQISAPQATIKVQTERAGIRISPDLYGIFFEEINCGGDGGLYAEMIRNRSFEDDPNEPVSWHADLGASISLDRSHSADPQNPTALRLSASVGPGKVAVRTDGYWGIPLQPGRKLRFSCLCQSDGQPRSLAVSLVARNGYAFERHWFDVPANGRWNTLSCEFDPGGVDPAGELEIALDKPGTVFFDMVSLFPADTFRGRSNGLRPDLAQKLADLHPSFMRFPGGCWVEGDNLSTSMRWKATIGPLADRRTQPDLWGYMSTNGLGFHEYLQLCEDIGAAPLFVINCGMSHHGNVPMDEMDGRVQDAIDAIEYANGPVTSKWGALRAKNGHPKPFHLKYLEIGNENGGPAYRERYPLIARAVKARFPDVHLIANVWGGYPGGNLTEIVDEHYYSNPQFFFDNADRYDRYDRKGPKVYVGEYAVTQGCGGGNLIAAIGEAAFMTGMERNSDVVRMCSYAPLFANVNHKTWNPDLINFDNHRSLGTPSYYVQQMFSQNRGDRVLPVEVSIANASKPTFPKGGVGVGTWGTQSEYKDFKVISDGRVLLDSPDGSALKQGMGRWEAANGTLRQSGDQEGTAALASGDEWSNYTLTLKARKLGGREGFLIYFGTRDARNWMWWNVGGWGNSQSAIERSIDGDKSTLGSSTPGSVETGRWYDLRIEYTPGRVRCYLDGKLVEDLACPAPKPLFVVASRVEKSGEVLLKIVNSAKSALRTDFDLAGLHGRLRGTATVLTSARPTDENTLDQPRKVAPVTTRFESPSERFARVLPAYSVTILRCSSR